MHSEVQIAVNFVLSFLYNKLPRRRVNQFGEELEMVLKSKFEDHWHPETPFKGSQFRCLRFSRPLDPFVFDLAAQRSGLILVDIQEHLPTEMTIWVDPGEVSYRLGENEPVKTLFSRKISPTSTIASTTPATTILSQNTASLIATNNNKDIETNILDGHNHNHNREQRSRKETSNDSWKSVQLNPNAPTFTPTMMMHSRPQLNCSVTYTAADFAATKFGSTKRRINNIKKTKPIELNGGYGGRPGKLNKHTTFGTQSQDNVKNIIKSQNGPFFDSYDWRNLQDNNSNSNNNNNHHNAHNTNPQQQQQQQIFTVQNIDSSTLQTQTNQQNLHQDSNNIWTMNENESNLFNSSFLDRYLPREHNFRVSMAAVENVTFNKNNQNNPQQQQQINHQNTNRWDDLFNCSTTMDIGFNFKPSPADSSSSYLTTSGSGTELSGYYSSSSCTLSSLSSPSLASTDFSLHLINEFDNLSLNSTSSSSVGSSVSSSYVN